MSAAYPILYVRAKPITKSDTVNIEFGPPDAVYVGGAGNIVLVFTDDTTATLAVIAGQTLPFPNVKRVNSTNTTATAMFAFYTT